MHAVKDRGLDISASSNLKVFFIKNYKTTTSSFVSCYFTLALTSADIIFTTF